MKLLLTLLLFVQILLAHPHTFIEVYPNITIKQDKIETIQFTWKLDEMTSSMLIMELDENINGKIDKEENDYAYASYFSALINNNYYTDITINDTVQVFPDPQNFQAFIENNRLCYSFEINSKYNIDTTRFDFADTDFFIAMILKKEFISINKEYQDTIEVSELDNDFYFGYRMGFK